MNGGNDSKILLDLNFPNFQAELFELALGRNQKSGRQVQYPAVKVVSGRGYKAKRLDAICRIA